MLPLLLETLVSSVHSQIQQNRPFQWYIAEPTKEDLITLQKEALGDSTFDPLKLRKTMYEDYEKGVVDLICKEGRISSGQGKEGIVNSVVYAKILVLVYPNQRSSIPWKTFARIFQAFSKSTTNTPWRVFLFANPTQRRLPPSPPLTPKQVNSSLHVVSSKHINGGYTYPCSSNAIVVYRLEEADRVLIHELFHASCSDNPKDSVEESKSYRKV